MVVGHGLLGTAFLPRYGGDPGVVVFASGVANSSESDPRAFARERELLQRTRRGAPEAKLVYFSTCSVDDPERRDTPYAVHKRAMEDLVREAPRHLVVRLPQVVGRTTNPHTLTNALCNAILEGGLVTVWQFAERNLLDVDDVVAIVGALLDDDGLGSGTVVVAGPETVPVPTLVALFEKVLGRRARTLVEPRGAHPVIDGTLAARYAARAGVSFTPGYTERLLRKYYGDRTA